MDEDMTAEEAESQADELAAMAEDEIQQDVKADGEVEDNLWRLYVAECERTKTRPRMSDYLVWKEESGYNDDLEDMA